jgi:hypothetical protein
MDIDISHEISEHCPCGPTCACDGGCRCCDAGVCQCDAGHDCGEATCTVCKAG